MKSLKESIFSDVEDIANDDTVLFEQFLKDNYQIGGTYIIKNGVIDVKGDVRVKNKHIKSQKEYEREMKLFFFKQKTNKFW